MKTSATERQRKRRIKLETEGLYETYKKRRVAYQVQYEAKRRGRKTESEKARHRAKETERKRAY